MTINSHPLFQEGLNEGMTALLVMLVEELEAQGVVDKGLLLERVFNKIALLEQGAGMEKSVKEAGIIAQLRSVARPLDKKVPRLSRVAE